MQRFHTYITSSMLLIGNEERYVDEYISIILRYEIYSIIYNCYDVSKPCGSPQSKTTAYGAYPCHSGTPPCQVQMSDEVIIERARVFSCDVWNAVRGHCSHTLRMF